MSRPTHPLLIQLAALFALFVLIPVPGIAQDDEPGLTIGSVAPAFNIEHWISDGNGDFVQITDFEPGKVCVFHFWNSKTNGSIESLAIIAETQRKFADKGVQIISITEEGLDTIGEFLETRIPRSMAKNKQDLDGESAGNFLQKTWKELTDTWSVAADPDLSVHRGFPGGAGIRRIPVCFIIGKNGLIEWIGHPNLLDDPLSKVVNDNWDREAFKEKFRDNQAQATLITDIFKAVRVEGLDGGLAKVADVRKKFEKDSDFQKELDEIEYSLRASSPLRKQETGDLEGAVEELARIIPETSGVVRLKLNSLRCDMAREAANWPEASEALREVTEDGSDPTTMNNLAWRVYESTLEDDSVPADLLETARLAAEKAVELAPDQGAFLDTLAHLVYIQGDLDRAIELQTRALKFAGTSRENIEEFLQQLQREKDGK